MMQQEHVVLLNAQGKPEGILEKYAAHHENTPLHLAFSCWVFNSQGQYLLTRRALTKKAWPGVWTNSVCGHPQWEETQEEAIHRRCRYETGVNVENITPVSPHFRYCETDANGIMENEICPVYAALAVNEVQPHPEEVMDYHWVQLNDVIASVRHTPWVFSPWMVQLVSDSSAISALNTFVQNITRSQR